MGLGTETYYPPPESAGGWRWLEDPEQIRTLGGLDPDRLELVRQRQEFLYGSDSWAIVIIRHGYLVREYYTFNVLIPTIDTSVFVHIARAGNISSNYTIIEHPLTNNRANAIVFVTPNWNPGGVGGTYNDHPIGVWYSAGAKKWAIFNQDIASMPDGAAFNVMIPAVDTSVFVHIARAENTGLNYTIIDHPLTNNVFE